MVLDCDRSLLFSSLVEVVCCDVIYVLIPSFNGKLFFDGAHFLWCMCSIILCIE